jgi:hypothetical protein
MKLFEIIGLKNPSEIKDFKNTFVDPKINTQVQTQAARKNPKWKKSLKDSMKKYGFELIGAGINGAVFKNPNYPFVLKIYRTDQGFDEWLYFCRTNKDNPYLPKIKGQPIVINKIFTAVRLEPLKELLASDIYEAYIFLNKLEKLEKLESSALKNKKEIIEKSDNYYLVKIIKFLQNFEPFRDLSDHNLMRRENGDFVIIDPIYINPNEKTDWFDI